MTIINKVSNRTLMPGITPIPDVPDTPTIGSATATGATTATVSYTAATTGGTATTFTATSTPGSLTGTGSSPITVTGLTGETSYTFTVRASNSTGNSPFSSASNSITTDATTAYSSIQTITLSSTQASISFTSIPQTYTHLQVRAIMRDNVNNATAGMTLTLNGDSTTSNYASHRIYGPDTATVGANGNGGSNSMGIGSGIGDLGLANTFGANIIDFLDYTNTNKYKTVRSFHGSPLNGDGYLLMNSNLWKNTNAINSITFTPGGTLFAVGCVFALYGIKG